LRNVGEAAAGESEDPPPSFTPSWIVLENRQRGGCLRGGEGGLEGINTCCSLRVIWMPAQLAQQVVNQSVEAGRPFL
jgi:hypothetical protein